MRIKYHIAVVILGCSGWGLGFAISLATAFGAIESDIRDLGPDSVAIDNVARLETLLGQWLLSCDLVLNGGETYLLEGAHAQSEELLAVLDGLSASRLTSDNQHDVSTIKSRIRLIQDWVFDAAMVSGPGRPTRVNDLITKVDRDSSLLIEEVFGFKNRMTVRAAGFVSELEARRGRLTQFTLAADVLYLVLVVVAWRWAVTTMVAPLQDLSDVAAAVGALDHSFDLVPCGPTEIRELTNAVAVFASRLQHERAATED